LKAIVARKRRFTADFDSTSRKQAIATAPDFSARRMVRDYVGAIYPA
jgi:hypothetical protein